VVAMSAGENFRAPELNNDGINSCGRDS
jgi:hypothetical protein